MAVVRNGTELVGLNDRELIKRAKQVFGGDMVKSAMFVIDHFQHNPDTQAAQELKGIRKIFGNRNRGEQKAKISYDSCDILIIFKNGRQVYFNNSEWAFMELIEGEIRVLD